MRLAWDQLGLDEADVLQLKVSADSGPVLLQLLTQPEPLRPIAFGWVRTVLPIIQ